MGEGDFDKSDGDILYASEVNMFENERGGRLMCFNFLPRIKNDLSAGNSDNTTQFPQGFFYNLGTDIADTKTNLTYFSARACLHSSPTKGSDITFISKKGFWHNTINSAAPFFDAEIITLGDECSDSSIDGTLWTTLSQSPTEGTNGLILYTGSGQTESIQFDTDFKVSPTNALIMTKVKHPSFGAAPGTISFAGVTIKSSSSFHSIFVIKVDNTAETFSCWEINQTTNSGWELLFEDQDISGAGNWRINYSVGGTATETINWIRVYTGSTTGSLTYSFSADGGSNFQGITNGKMETMTNTGKKPIFKLTSASLAAGEYVIIRNMGVVVED